MFMPNITRITRVCCLLALVHTGSAAAWSDQLDDTPMNTTCKPEPRAQCSWAPCRVLDGLAWI